MLKGINLTEPISIRWEKLFHDIPRGASWLQFICQGYLLWGSEMYSLLCTIFTWSGFHKFTNTHSHSTPLKWSTLSQTKANQVVVLCIDKSLQLNKVTEDIFNTFRRGCNYALYRRQTLLNKHVRCSSWPPFFKICARTGGEQILFYERKKDNCNGLYTRP